MKNNHPQKSFANAFGRSKLRLLSDKFWVILLLFACGASVQAQSVSLTSGGFVSVSGQLPGTPMSMQSPLGTGLQSHINFGDVVSNSAGRRVRIIIPVRVSATTNYKIQLQRLSTDGNGGVQPQDIGFGVLNARPQTANNPKLTANATNLSINGNFGSNPSAAPVINGSPQFAATIADISESPTTILTGVPTVADGSLGENDNSILIDLTCVIVPQYFALNDLSALSLTLIITPLP